MFFYFFRKRNSRKVRNDQYEDAIYFHESLTDEELQRIIGMIVMRMKEISVSIKEEVVKWDEQSES